MLDELDVTIEEERSTTKTPLDDADVRGLLAKATSVVIARGKSRRELDPGDVQLDDLKGPSGKFRAPILLAGGVLHVGFNSELASVL